MQDRPEPSPARWTDLRSRVISAAVLAPLAIAAIWEGGLLWAAVILGTAAGLAGEWVRMCGASLGSAAGLAIPVAILLAGGLVVPGHPVAALALLAAGFAVAAWAGGRHHLRLSLAAGVPYIGFACIAMLSLRADPAAGRVNVLLMMLVVWASDVGAYAAGRLIGGPPLAPRISPKKTWAGAVGGLVAAVLIAEAAAGLVGGASFSGRIALIAALLGIAAQAGDLFESFMKRRFGVKDSSRIIPGHGGLLDRLDGVLAAAPVTALLALLAGRGVVLWQ